MRDDDKSTGEYRYRLYRFNSDELKGYIDLIVNPNGLRVEDYTTGETTETFFGRDDHEYVVGLTKDKAIKVLEAYGILPGNHPVEKLARWFAERHTGDNRAASAFRKMAEDAGVAPEVFVW